MGYIKKDIVKEKDNQGTGLRPRQMVSFFDVEDIASFPATDDKEVKLVGDIVMKPGRYAFCVYGTPGTVEITSSPEGDTDQVGYKPSMKFNHPGNTLSVREFKMWATNRRFIVATRYCDGGPADVIGTPCNPCKLSSAYTGNSESNVNEFTIEQITKGSDVFVYEGTFPLEEPVQTLAAGATSIAYSVDGQYQTTAGTATIASITGGTHGAVITVLGCAGTSPTIAPVEGKIVLKSGRVFTCTEGSQLTLKAYADDENSLIWIEQSRYEAV